MRDMELIRKHTADRGAHGTATKLGLPAGGGFRKYTEKKGVSRAGVGEVEHRVLPGGGGSGRGDQGAAGAEAPAAAAEDDQLRGLNEHIELKESPFYVNDRVREWE